MDYFTFYDTHNRFSGYFAGDSPKVFSSHIVHCGTLLCKGRIIRAVVGLVKLGLVGKQNSMMYNTLSMKSFGYNLEQNIFTSWMPSPDA